MWRFGKIGGFNGYGEMALVALCVGVVASAPLGVQGETWAVIAWTAASNVASYVKGKLESRPGKPASVEVKNDPSDPVPVEVEEEKK